ncbi:MAG: hypothetical protein Kow0089_08740 [Desulfobulbaceae bacterium]
MQIFFGLALFCLTAALLPGCSGDREAEEKPGKIETMTREAGQEAVRMIKTPIDKAQAVSDKEAKRAEEMEKRGDR